MKKLFMTFLACGMSLLSFSQAENAVSQNNDIQQKNIQMIGKVNSFTPEYVADDLKKDAGRLLCALNIGKESQIVNEDVEIITQCGRLSTKVQQGRGGIAAAVNNANGGSLGNDVEYEEIGTFTSNPALLIKIKNKTKKTLYIDLGNCFFIRNEEATAFYIPSSTSTNNTTGSGASVNLGAVAGALGVGGAMGTLANGVNVGGGSSNSTVNTTYAQRIVAVPPMSTKLLDPQLLFPKNGMLCDGMYIENVYKGRWTPSFNFKDKEHEQLKCGETFTYQEENSPIKFSAYITYSDTENCATTKNLSVSYYLHSLTGYAKPSGMTSINTGNVEKRIPNFDKGLCFIGTIQPAAYIKAYKMKAFARN